MSGAASELGLSGRLREVVASRGFKETIEKH